MRFPCGSTAFLFGIGIIVLYRNRTGKLPCAKIAVNNNARWQHKSSPALIKWSDDNPTHPSNTDRMLLQQVSSFRAYCVQGRDTREQRKDVLYERWVVEYSHSSPIIARKCDRIRLIPSASTFTFFVKQQEDRLSLTHCNMQTSRGFSVIHTLWLPSHSSVESSP